MHGWKKHSRTVSALVCMVGCMTLRAAEPQVEESALPAGFLEFLGEWEGANGSWQDPMALDGPEWQSLDDDLEQQDETD